MGIEDAVVLTEELARCDGLEEALQRFMTRRFDRAKLVVDVSCEVARAEAEHTVGFDAAARIREASAVLVQPY
jgi:2-polyprenyl-6-methoxyphenol hydroxylase-like FAD-dependent oxidoreductase